MISVYHKKRAIDVYSGSVENAIDQYAWKGDIVIVEEDDFYAIKLKDEIIVKIYSEFYKFIIDSKSLSLSGVSASKYKITIISSSDLFGTFQENRLNGYYIGEKCSGVVKSNEFKYVWSCKDYTVPGIKLVNESNIGLLQTLANAVGAVVNTKKDGSIIVRKKQLKASSEWINAQALEIKTSDKIESIDITKNIKSTQRLRGIRFNFKGNDYKFSAELDSRPNGYNRGRTSFNPGDDVYFLVRCDHDFPYATTNIGTLTKDNIVYLDEEYDIRQEPTWVDGSWYCNSYIENESSYKRTRKVTYFIYRLHVPDDITEATTITVDFDFNGTVVGHICYPVSEYGIIQEVDNSIIATDPVLRKVLADSMIEEAKDYLEVSLLSTYIKNIDVTDLVEFSIDNNKFIGRVESIRHTFDKDKVMSSVRINSKAFRSKEGELVDITEDF